MSRLTQSQRGLSRNFTGYIPGDNVNRDVVIRELQDKVKELQLIVNELQTFQMQSRAVDIDGFPSHLAKCELLRGQWIRLAQTALAPMIVRVEHGLRRKPQGLIWTFNGQSGSIAMIAGDPPNGVDPASSTSISIRLNGSVGDTHVGILF